MLAYTVDEIFDLLATVSCESDLLEIHHYILTNQAHYTDFDMALFEKSIGILERVFK